MQTAIWGSKGGLWTSMDAICGNAPEVIPKDRQHIYKRFLVDDLKELLPCKWCRISFVEYSNDLPIEAFYDTRAGLMTWMWKIHSLVNKKLSKRDISFFDYIKKVESMRAKCSKTGAKGCTEPHIEKNHKMCETWANLAWAKYGNIDMVKWKHKKMFWTISKYLFQGILTLTLMFVVFKVLIKNIMKNKSSALFKILMS